MDEMSAAAKISVLLLAFIPFLTEAKLAPLREIFGWKQLDFEFESNAARQDAIRTGRFIPGNTLSIDLLSIKDRVFITLPRWKKGIPATLATVPSSPKECVHGKRCAPLLRPWPNWKWNSGDGVCDYFTSVFAVNEDKCGRLWVLDSGVVDAISADSYILCPPQLFLFDLKNDQLIRRYIFPYNTIKTNTLLITVAIETVSTHDNCANTFAYSSDISAYGLLVTDGKTGKSWRVENKLFYPYPNWETFNIAGQTFEAMDGIRDCAVYPDPNPKTRRLYFHALAAARENYVLTKILHNATEANLRTDAFIFTKGEKPSQAAASAFDSRGILFFGLLGKLALACWNTSKPHIPANIPAVSQDDKALQFLSGLKVCTYCIYR